MARIAYFIDGVRLIADSSESTVRALLEQAGVSPDRFYLEHKGVEFRDPNQKIEIMDGDQFATKPRADSHPVEKITHYKVNGEEQATPQSMLTVKQILRNAGRTASIDTSQLSDYFLQNIEDGTKYERLEDSVSIKPGDQFLAIHRGRTPVA